MMQASPVPPPATRARNGRAEIQPAGEQVVVDLEDVARRAGDQPDRLVARVARRIGQRLVLGANVYPTAKERSFWPCFTAGAALPGGRQRLQGISATNRTAERGMKGYFGIGVEGVSKAMNVGTLFRTAHAFGASFVFTLRAQYNRREGSHSDTSDTPRSVPTYQFRRPRSLPPAAGLPAGRRRDHRRGDRAAELPPSAPGGLHPGGRARGPVAPTCSRSATTW